MTKADLLLSIEQVTDWLLSIGVSEYLVEQVTLDAFAARGITEHHLRNPRCTHLRGGCDC